MTSNNNKEILDENKERTERRQQIYDNIENHWRVNYRKWKDEFFPKKKKFVMPECDCGESNCEDCVDCEI